MWYNPARRRPFDVALREASIGRVRPKLMTFYAFVHRRQERWYSRGAAVRLAGVEG